jgi:RimJ/RimL family protein N-acetyltransferase
MHAHGDSAAHHQATPTDGLTALSRQIRDAADDENASRRQLSLCQGCRVPQPILRTARLLLTALADRHLELEAQLDSDPEVLRYICGRARSRDEVVASHTQRMALADTVDGLGYWVAFGSAGRAPDAVAPEREDDGDFVGLMMLPPAHGPDQPDDPTVADLGYRLVRRSWRQGLASEAS